MKQVLGQLRQAIRAKHKSVHAFCRDNPEIGRSSVYQVLSGRYAGDSKRQIERIREALGEPAPPRPKTPVISTDTAYAVLQESKCGHCRKLDKRACSECRTQTLREAQALTDYLGRAHEQDAG